MNITNKLDNTTATYTEDGNVTVTLTADSGFIIVQAKASYMSNMGFPNEATFKVKDDGKTAVATIDDLDGDFIEVNGEVEIDGGGVEIINNIADTRASIIEEGEVVSIQVKGTGKNKRLINATVSYTDFTGGDNTINLNVSFESQITTGTAVLEYIDLTQPIYLNGSFEEVVIIEYELTNCFITNRPEYLPVGDTLTVTIEPNESTEFSTNALFAWMNDEGLSYQKELTPQGVNMVGSIKLTGMSSITVLGDCIPVKQVGRNYGSINVYKVSLEDLDTFSSKRFFKQAGTDPETGATVYTQIDLGDYVDRIRRLHVEVKDGATDVIRCGEWSTGIKAVQPDSDKITLDFGNVEIPHFNGDAIDYNGTVSLFLPFRGFVTLPNTFIGRTIQLVYEVNVITGGGVAKVIHNGLPVLIEDVQPSSDILYRVANEQVIKIGNIGFNEQVLYGLNPFVMCEWYKANIPGGINFDSKVGIIGDFKGFNSFKYVDPISKKGMLTTEQTLIYDLLEQGVYIE